MSNWIRGATLLRSDVYNSINALNHYKLISCLHFLIGKGTDHRFVAAFFVHTNIFKLAYRLSGVLVSATIHNLMLPTRMLTRVAYAELAILEKINLNSLYLGLIGTSGEGVAVAGFLYFKECISSSYLAMSSM